MIANPFTAIDNTVGGLFPGVPFGTTIYKWDATAQAFISNVYIGGWQAPNMTLLPGEGAIFQSGENLTLIFVGEVTEGYSDLLLPQGQSIAASVVPYQGLVMKDLDLPVWTGDTVTKMEGGVYSNYTYNGSGQWAPSEPSIALGESFWNNKTFLGFSWRRNVIINLSGRINPL